MARRADVFLSARRLRVNPKKKVQWAEQCLKRAVALLPMQTTVRMTYWHEAEGTATCAADPKYFRAHININLEDLHTKKDIAKYVFHEVVHIPLWPLYLKAKRLAKNSNEPKVLGKDVYDTNEFVTTTIELMFFELVFPEFKE